MFDTFLKHLSQVPSMSDVELLHFVKSDLFYATMMIFVFGLLYKSARIFVLGIPKNRAKPKGSPFWATVKILLLKPYFVLSFKDIRIRRAVTVIAGIIFHIAFLLLIFFIPQHSFVWYKLTGVQLPYFGAAISNILAYGAVIALLALWINRVISPVTRILTGKDEHIANFLILLALITGIFANTWAGSGAYPKVLTLHILAAEALIVYIPFSRLSHFLTYFYSLAFYGRSLGISGARE